MGIGKLNQSGCQVPERSSNSSHAYWLPFARLNLIRNPFGELTPAERAEAAVIDFSRWRQLLQQSEPVAIQFVGECGRGKSTHLHALKHKLSESAYVYLPEDGPLPKIPIGSPLLIDEAQRLGWRRRREAFGRGVHLVLGTHVDLSKPLRRAGYDVQTYEVSQQVSAEHLQRIFQRRIELARLGEGKLPDVSAALIRTLMNRHQDCIRAMEADLYEHFNQMVGAEGTKTL